MLKNKAFISQTEEYDRWFDKNANAYESELLAFKELKIDGDSIEIGVGTGKFAHPLGIKLGIEPTKEMYERALELGISVIEARAEALPIPSDKFDWAIMITTICFVTDPAKSLSEAHRILKKGGKLAIGLVDKDTKLGKLYLAKKDKSQFYKEATFFSSKDIINLMTEAGFRNIQSLQTLKDVTLSSVETPEEGYGEGGFVAIWGEK